MQYYKLYHIKVKLKSQVLFNFTLIKITIFNLNKFN